MNLSMESEIHSQQVESDIDSEESQISFCFPLPAIVDKSEPDLDITNMSASSASLTGIRFFCPETMLLEIHRKINQHLQNEQRLTRAQVWSYLNQLKNVKFSTERDRHTSKSAQNILIKILRTFANKPEGNTPSTESFRNVNIPDPCVLFNEISEAQVRFMKRSISSDLFPSDCTNSHKKAKLSDVPDIDFPLELLTNQNFQSYYNVEVGQTPNANFENNDEAANIGDTNDTLTAEKEELVGSKICNNDSTVTTNREPVVADTFNFNNTVEEASLIPGSNGDHSTEMNYSEIVINQTLKSSPNEAVHQSSDLFQTCSFTAAQNSDEKGNVDDRAAKLRRKFLPKWSNMTNEEKVNERFLKKFKMNIFEDPVDRLLDLDYSQSKKREIPTTVAVRKFYNKIATTNYQELDNILTEAARQHILSQNCDGNDNESVSSDDSEKQWKSRINKLEQIGRENIRTLVESGKEQLAKFEEKWQRKSDKKKSWDELIKYWTTNTTDDTSN